MELYGQIKPTFVQHYDYVSKKDNIRREGYTLSVSNPKARSSRDANVDFMIDKSYALANHFDNEDMFNAIIGKVFNAVFSVTFFMGNARLVIIRLDPVK